MTSSATTFDAGLGRKSEAVLNALRAQLEGGAHAPGTRLPTEDELCRRFGASRGTVRRATARLAAEGRIHVRHGSGAFVCERDNDRPRSRTIAVMFPFDRRSLQQVQQRVLAMGHLLCVYTHDGWSPRAERAFLERVKAERHHALLAFCTPKQPRNDDMLLELEQAGIRVIHVEHYRETPPDQSFVLPDYRRAGYMGASALMIAGYEDLYFVGMRDDGPFASLKRQGFMDAIADQRPGFDPKAAYFDVPAGMHAASRNAVVVERFIRGIKRPTGLLCRSRNFARVMIEFAQHAGLRIPEDLGIISAGYLLDDETSLLTDEIDFDWSALLDRALAEIERPQRRRVQEWIAPVMRRRGTVRQTEDTL